MTWSLSKLGTYEKCAAMYKFKYIEKLPTQTNKYASRGTEMHLAMELFIKGEMEKLPPELSYYTQFLSDLMAHPDYTLLPEHKLAVDQEWKPASFEEGFWWRGVLDLHIQHPKGIIFYDWKSGKIYDDHQDQREIYSLGEFAHHDVEEVTAVHVYLDLKQNRQTVYHRDMVPELQKKWELRVEKMLEEKDYTPFPGFYCRYCSFSRAKGGPCQF